MVPNRDLTLAQGAVQPWLRAGAYSPWFTSLLESLADSYGFSMRVPVKELEEEHLDLILYGNKGRSVRMRHRTRRGRSYEWDTTFEGAVNNLERRYRETESDHVRSDIERYMASRPCTVCKGQRLKPEAPRRDGGRDKHHGCVQAVHRRRAGVDTLAVGPDNHQRARPCGSPSTTESLRSRPRY